MPSDAHLYGIRAPKNQKKEISSSTTLAFTSQLSSLLSSSSTSTRPSSGRPRPSGKPDMFKAHNRNTKKRALRDLEESNGAVQQRRTDGEIVDEATMHRSKRRMEEKARKYAAMKRGDYVAGEGEPEALIDFDRKWAEDEAAGKAHYETESEEDDEEEEIVEYEDEYGRTVRGTVAEKQRMERRRMRGVHAAEELERMSGRPKLSGDLIYGDTIQAAAFNPDIDTTEKMEALARKRDRSLTPPEMKHYEADKEIRNKGTGFYSFSKDEEIRRQEMEGLEAERKETERVRSEREERKAKRAKEIEERRRLISEKRAKKQADNFLEELGANLGGGE